MVNSNRDHFQHAIEHMTEIHRKWPGIFDEMVTRRIPINEFKAALNNPPPVNGFPGIEIEQGYQDLPNGSKHHYPTVVSWFENGARYTVYSQSANLNEIRAFAKTMFE